MSAYLLCEYEDGLFDTQKIILFKDIRHLNCSVAVLGEHLEPITNQYGLIKLESCTREQRVAHIHINDLLEQRLSYVKELDRKPHPSG